MASSSSNQNCLVVEVYFNGMFLWKPLTYFDPDRKIVRDVDFKGFSHSDFIAFLEKLTRTKCNDVYCCLPQDSLSEGIHAIQNDGDYKEFLDMGYANGNRIDVYVDHYNKPLFDWIEAEEVEEERNTQVDPISETDDDSVLSEACSFDHEEDEVQTTTNKRVNDDFLNILCPPSPTHEEEDANVVPIPCAQ